MKNRVKSGKPKELFKEISMDSWNRYKVVQRKISQGEKVLGVYLNKNSVLVVTEKICRGCGKTYSYYGTYNTSFSDSTTKYCSLGCINFAKGSSSRGKKRNPNQFHRGKSHWSYGVDRRERFPNVDWDKKVEVEIPLEEAKKYKRVQKVLLAGKKILKVVRVMKGWGGTIKIVTLERCPNCGKEVPSNMLRGRKTCSKKCGRELMGKTLSAKYKDGTYKGNTGLSAWNRDMKVDKEKYPNWGRGEWNLLDQEGRLKKMHKFACPRKKQFVLGENTYIVRSQFEQDFMTYLYAFEINFLYEPCLIQIEGDKGYIPDFFIPDVNLYIDTKCYARMKYWEKMSFRDILNWIRTRRDAIQQTKKSLFEIVWYEKFYGNPEGSLPKVLQKLVVGRNPQRPKVEESTTNKTFVGNVCSISEAPDTYNK
jgi:hypothetical protein